MNDSRSGILITDYQQIAGLSVNLGALENAYNDDQK